MENVRKTRKRKRRRKKKRKSRGGCATNYQLPLISNALFLSKSNVHYMNNIICRYSSQFNPDLAKQNKLDPKRKYWLE